MVRLDPADALAKCRHIMLQLLLQVVNLALQTLFFGVENALRAHKVGVDLLEFLS